MNGKKKRGESELLFQENNTGKLPKPREGLNIPFHKAKRTPGYLNTKGSSP